MAKLTELEDEIESYVILRKAYAQGISISDTLRKQVKYMSPFIKSTEHVQCALFLHVDFPGVNKNFATLVIFTENRLLMGYKYLFGIVKPVIVELDLNDCKVDPDDDDFGISFDTPKGHLGFDIPDTDKDYHWGLFARIIYTMQKAMTYSKGFENGTEEVKNMIRGKVEEYKNELDKANEKLEWDC